MWCKLEQPSSCIYALCQQQLRGQAECDALKLKVAEFEEKLGFQLEEISRALEKARFLPLSYSLSALLALLNSQSGSFCRAK